MTEVKLPAILANTSAALIALTDALGVHRSVLASDDSIETAWNTLPSLLKKIPPQLRTAGLARMCVAVASGLFDSAINYVWNSAVIELREKVKRFGLPVVAQIKGKNFDEAVLVDLKDADLLNLCLELCTQFHIQHQPAVVEDECDRFSAGGLLHLSERSSGYADEVAQPERTHGVECNL